MSFEQPEFPSIVSIGKALWNGKYNKTQKTLHTVEVTL